MKNIFVFGSNLAGVHGAGAAKAAFFHYGATWGAGVGWHGRSYALPTKDGNIQSLTLNEVKAYVDDFLVFADRHKNINFQVTRIGCGLAGFKDADIAPMFKNASTNCEFDTAWKPFLGEGFKYWGTF